MLHHILGSFAPNAKQIQALQENENYLRAFNRAKSTRSQTELRFIVGFPLTGHDPEIDSAINAIVEGISAKCGGCTVVYDEGYWKEDGAKHHTTFTGKLHIEEAVTFQVTCENHKLEDVYFHVRKLICETVTRWEIPVDWVHVIETPIIGRHFSVKRDMGL